MRSEFLGLFTSAAQRLLGEEEALYAGNYASFVQQASAIEKKLASQLELQLSKLKTYRMREFVSSLDAWLHESFTHISKQVWGRASSDLGAAQDSAPQLSSLSERALQTEIANINGIAFAAARVLNEVSNMSSRQEPVGLGSKKRKALADALPNLILAAHQLNCCVYAIDKVTYGEWHIRQIDATHCIFTLVDARLEYARVIGLRRLASQTLQKVRKYQQGDLHLQSQLEEILPKFLGRILEYFSQKCGFDTRIESYWELRRSLGRRLAELESADDLLALAAEEHAPAVGYDYIASVIVRWVEVVCGYVAKRISKRKQRNGETSCVPLSIVLTLLPFSNNDREGVGRSIRELCKFPPRASFHALLDHPSILLDDDSLVFIPALDAGRWAAAIRSKWLRTGTLGDNYGKIWEDYVCWLLTRGGWVVLKRNVKLKQNGRTATEIDLLVSRDRVCLVVQVKAIAGSGDNTYQHWKNRQTIEKGIAQARAATDLLGSANGYLASIIGKRAADSVDTLRGVVLTTVHYFNGWQKDKVSILSVPALENLMRGATVSFWSSRKGEVKTSAEHTVGTEISGSELLGFLDRPLDWRISSEEESVSEHSLEIEGVIWTEPFLGVEVFGVELHPNG
jgi:Holliday junction resolvase-like predicted endonuclease